MRYIKTFIVILIPWISVIGKESRVIDSLNGVYDEAYLSGNYLQANEVLLEIRDAYFQQGDSNKLIDCVIRQSDIYRATRQYKLAHLELTSLLESSYLLSHQQMVEIYSLQGGISYEENDYSSMLVFTEQAIETARQYGVEGALPGLHNLLGRYYVDVDRDLSWKYLNYSMDGFLEAGDTVGAVLPQLHIAYLYIKQGEYEKAMDELDAIDATLEKWPVVVYEQMLVLMYRNIYELKHDFKTALVYALASDSIHKVMSSKLGSVTSFYKTQDRVSEVHALQSEIIHLRAQIHQNQSHMNVHLMWGSAFLIFVLFVLGVYLTKGKKCAQLTAQNADLILKLEKKSKELASKRHHTITKANSLQEINEFKSKVLSILGHDLRGPIAQLITYQQAKEGGVDFSPEELVQMDKIILAGAQNSLLVLDNLLKWASEGSNENEEPPTKVNVAFLVNHITNQMRLTAKQKNVEILLGDLNFEFVAKESLVKLIVRNLLSNAVKYSENGDSVKIYAIQKEGRIKICIADTGKGIPSDVLLSIQNRGVNVKPEPGSMGERGIGLGIQLSSEFAQQINGVITFEKNTPKGTIASLVLPYI